MFNILITLIVLSTGIYYHNKEDYFLSGMLYALFIILATLCFKI